MIHAIYRFTCDECGHCSVELPSEKDATEYGKTHRYKAHIDKCNSRWNDFYSYWKRILETTQWSQWLKDSSYYPTLEYTYKAGYSDGLKDAPKQTKT